MEEKGYEKRHKKKKPNETNTLLEVIIILLTFLLILTIAIPVGRALLRREEASFALREGKTIVLAARAVSYEYGIGSESMSQNVSEVGISKAALKDIKELSTYEGTIEHITFDDKAMEVKTLRYRMGDVLVTYENPGDKQIGGWNVYYLDQIIEDETKK